MQFRDVRTVRVGGATKDELLTRLDRNAVSLNEYAATLFAASEFTTSAVANDVRIAVVSLAEIGLPHGGRYDEIVAHAGDAGLAECPLELAPHLRLQDLGQPLGPYLTVASQKVRADESLPNGLYLRRLRDGLWLRGYHSGAENLYAPNFTTFAFLYPT